MSHADRIASLLAVDRWKVAAAIELLDAGNTLPFVARYRKEATGNLDEEQLRRLVDTIESLRSLDDRRSTIVESIEAQGKLTPELRRALDAAESKTELEDLYLPYKPKRRTRASIARDRGLQPLADRMLAQAVAREDRVAVASRFVTSEAPTAEDALAGARDIVAETVSDDANVRRRLRERAMQWGSLRSERIPASEDSRGVYRLYYELEQRVDRLRPHQILAINRGEAEKVVRVRVDLAGRDVEQAIRPSYRPDARSAYAADLGEACDDAAKRLLIPAIEREVRAELTARAEAHAIDIFAANLRGLLTQPPLASQIILGIDPGQRTGCKLAVIDGTGKVLETGTIYPHAPQNQWDAALSTLGRMVDRHAVTLVTIGNGTASRETERLVADLIRTTNASRLRYLMVSEAGASVYSASPTARAELPELDVTLRGAVSIARRAQDPLAELVKIEPKAIGVGMYQHDVDQRRLERSLGGVVESVVNRVGVEVNTASAALLSHVAGIGPKLAERIVAYRNDKGAIRSRRELLDVSGLGPKAFEQSAGFLRIREGTEPLDASAIHPESYRAASAVLRLARTSLAAHAGEREAAISTLRASRSIDELARETGVGVQTLEDVLEQLVRPGRDPRSELPPPVLRSDVITMDDLTIGLVLTGTVRNVVDFGAFVDIGVKQDGLLHRSAWPRGATFGLGDVVDVTILRIEADRGRISLGVPDR